MSLWSTLRASSLVAVVAMSATSAFALDFASADDLYARREEGQGVIEAARQEYLGLLNQAASAGDKVRIVEQLGRLAFYQGELLLPKSDTAGRRKIFGDCWCKEVSVAQGSCVRPGFLDAISPANLGRAVPAYYYVKGVCAGYWGEAANTVEKATFSSTLRDNINDGLAQGNDGLNYEGGGIHRVTANVWSNPEARVVGLYDVRGALDQVNAALAAPATGGADAGSAYYDNARSKVLVLEQLAADEPNGGWKQQAVQYIDDTLFEMNDRAAQGQLPNGRAPEFNVFFRLLKSDYQNLAGTPWQAP